MSKSSGNWQRKAIRKRYRNYRKDLQKAQKQKKNEKIKNIANLNQRIKTNSMLAAQKKGGK